MTVTEEVVSWDDIAAIVQASSHDKGVQAFAKIPVRAGVPAAGFLFRLQ
jgi:hypothetical protein